MGAIIKTVMQLYADGTVFKFQDSTITSGCAFMCEQILILTGDFGHWGIMLFK